eukprot:CAMPEP_0202813348 /NCGR_PEP_ID=MMETSP1389-20130828/4723_1 /ASSEMBLY_ACC=CAM_ASM_000865 /TAXON_ID=302021 /ORGANISM="Rhodomonas sp., Strain CCMP768" /LENGTH=457 /DNA_ID=CAMNT_0049484911 /DNA_START=58 /DNA_END=1431 /DNA_ORIENTATION=+
MAGLALAASASALVLVTLLSYPAQRTELGFTPPWAPAPPHKNQFVHSYDKSVGRQQQLVQTELHYTPPWEQTPPHFNRYRFVRKGQDGRQEQLVQTELHDTPPWEQTPPHFNRYRFARGVASQARQQQLAVRSKARNLKSKRTGPQIWARMLGALAKKHHEAHKQAKQAPAPPSAAPGAKKALKLQNLEEMEEDPNVIDVNDDPPAETIYIYRGRETKPKMDELVTFILAGGFGIPDVKYIEDSSDAEMRKALWDEQCRAVVFPPMHDIPDFGPNAVKDMRHYVSKGMKNHGTMLFMGSSVEIHIINKVFGFEMQQDFKPGPYYKSERHTHGTALELLPERVNELGNTESLGVLKASLPPDGRSFYDSFGDSVASCVRYDLGRVCYLAQDFEPLLAMPELEQELQSADDEVAEDAERRLEALGRKTDTWLAIFEGMLENPIEEEVEEPVLQQRWEGY